MQPTPPYYRHVIPMEIIEVSSLSSLCSSSSSSNAPDYMPRPLDAREDYENAMSTLLALTPIEEDDEIEEDP